jgi:guanylate kinase
LTGRLFVLSGPSGSGKSTIISRVLDLIDIDFSVSVTTRLPRPGEVDGVHYLFVSREQFLSMIEGGRLLEWAEYNDNLYGTPAEPIEMANSAGRDVLLDIEIQGARQVKANRPQSVMIFIAPPSIHELESRLRLRGDTSDLDIAARLAIAEEQLQLAFVIFDFVVINDALEDAVAEVASLITGAT